MARPHYHTDRLLRFAIRYPGWHSYGTDRTTTAALASLERRRLLEVNRDTRQFRLAVTDDPPWHRDPVRDQTPVTV